MVPVWSRAAAKNFKNVSIITSAADYDVLIKELKKHDGDTSLKFRENLASKAFGLTSYYDSVISNWFNKKLNIKFPEVRTTFLEKVSQLRYGENPHQEASLYLKDEDLGFKKIKGKPLSFNNYNDIFTGLEILGSFKKGNCYN